MYVCAHMCFSDQKQEQEPVAFYTLWRTSGDRLHRLLVQSGGGREGGEAKVLGEPFRSADPQTTRAHGD